jgi:hypothetical protein
MESSTHNPTTTDVYIAQFQEERQQILQKVRAVPSDYRHRARQSSIVDTPMFTYCFLSLPT